MYSISLQTSKPVVTADDIIGIVNFAASNEQDRRDSIFVGATISAIAEGTFTQVSNPTSLVFTTSDSGPANEQVRITSVGNVGIGNPTPQYKLDVKGEFNILPYNTTNDTIRVGRASGKASIKAEGTEAKDKWLIIDSNGSPCALNYFTGDNVLLAYGGGGVSVGTTNPGSHKFRVAGGTTAIDGGHFTFNDNGGNFDFRIEGDTDPNLVYVDASTDNVGIGLNTPLYKLDVEGSARLNAGDAGNVVAIANNGTILAQTQGATFVSANNNCRYTGNKGPFIVNNYYDGTNPIDKDTILQINNRSNNFAQTIDFTTGTVTENSDAAVRWASISKPNTTTGLQYRMYGGSNPTGYSYSPSHEFYTVKNSDAAGTQYQTLKMRYDETTMYTNGAARLLVDIGGKVGIGTLTPETKLHVETSTMLDGIRVSGNSLPSVQIVSTGDSSSHAIIGNNQGQLTIAADMTSVGGTASALQLGVKGETVLKITPSNAEVVGSLSANTINLGPSASRHFSIYRDNAGTFGSAVIQDSLGDIKLISGSAVAIKIMNDSTGSAGGIRFHDAYTFPQVDGQNGYVLKTDGNGTLSWQVDNSSTGGGGDVTGTGTNGYAARWSNDTTLTTGVIRDNGTSASIKTPVTGRALTVGGTTNSNSAILIKGSGVPVSDGSRGFLLSHYGNGDAYLWNFETRPMIFATSNTEAMRIGSDGNVGIGTASPLYKLDVTNNARVGDIIIGDTAYSVSSAYQGITHNTWAGDNQGYMIISDGNDTLVSSNRNTVIRCNVNDGTSQMQVTSILTQLRQDNNYVALRNGSTKFNENSNNVDFIVHGDTKLNMIYVDASADKVGVATSTPTESLTVSGGLENLYGWKWFASLGNTVGQGPASGFLLQLNEEYGNILSKAYHYTVRLSTNSTGTDTGASYLIWWNNATSLWEIRAIGQANSVSNHPMVEITNDGTYDRVRVYTDNSTPYPIRCQVESLFHGDHDCKPHSMGSDYHWQRLVDNLYHTEGNVGIGISTPALQSAGRGLHINSDGLHSEIKFTNTATGEGAGDGVALVATNSSFTINNRSAGEVNINTNNVNAISINSAQDVDVKQLLKVRRSNTVGTAGEINRVSFYDDGVTHSAGVGMSSGNVNYVAKGSVTQSFYTGGIKNLRLDPTGKVVMGPSSNVVAGDASLNYNVGICTNAATNVAMQVLKVAPATGVSSFFNQYNRLTVPSGDLTAVRGVYQDIIIENGADLTNVYGYATGTNTVNTGGNVDTVIGYYVNNSFFRGSSSNYGIYSDVNSDITYPTPENKWGLFLAGTAPNYYRSGMKTSILDGRFGSDYICERVAGGYKAVGNVTTNPGYLKIRLPEYKSNQKAGSTMITFDVSVYEYKAGGYKNFHLGGYVYWNTSSQQSTWINTTATMEVDRDIDNAAPWIVRFATDEDDYPCVLIGRSGQNEATNWSYGQIYIQNVRTGFGRVAWDQWSQNWQISLETRSTGDGGYYNVSSGFINKPFMHNQLEYKIVAGSYDLSNTGTNQVIIDQTKTVFNENGVNADFRVESDANQHMVFVDASADVVGIGLSNPRSDAILHVGGPSSQNPTLMIGTGGNISSSICSLKFQDRGPAQDQTSDGQITGYVQMERDGNSQNFDMTFGTVNTTAGDAVERMRIDRAGLVGIGTNAPSKLLHVDNSGKGSGTSVLIEGDDDSYMSVQNSTSGDFLKLGSVYTNNNYMGLSHSDITNSGFMIMSDGLHTFLSSNTNGRIYIRGGRNDGNQGEIRVGDGIVQVNPSALNTDFRVCGDSVAELLRVDASKDAIYIGNSTDGGVNSRLYVYDDGAAKTNVANSRTLQVQGRAYTTTNGTHYHIGALTRAEKWLSGGSTDAGYCIGLNAVPVVYSNSDDGTNSLTELTAVRANMSINSSLADGVNITNAFDIKAIPSLQGTNSTVTNHYGLYLTSATNGATTVTNAYGVVQEDASATNLFVGNMTIGSNVQPDSFDGLTVYGNISAKRTDGKLMAKDAAVVCKMQASVGAGGGILGTESNHNLIIRSNNADVARFDVNGNFQVKKGKTNFSPQTDAGTDLYGGLYVQAPDMLQTYCVKFKGYPTAGAGYNIDQNNDLRIEPNGSSMVLKFRSNPVLNDPTLAVRNAIEFNPNSVQFNNFSGFRGTPVETFKVNTDTGALTINQSYTLPTADGSSGQVLTTDGSGQVSWAAGSSSGGGSSNNLVSMCCLTTDPGGPSVPTSVNFITSTFANPAYVPWWGFNTQTQTGNTDIFSVSGDTLTVSQAGIYQVSANVTFTNTGANRAMAGCCLKYGNTMLDETIQYSYTRGTNYGVKGSLSPSITMFIAANGTIKVALWKESADQASALNTTISRLTVVRLGDDVLLTTSPGQ